jgi:putative glutathione S-transferase
MGRLIDGEWSTEDLGSDAKGNYVRRATKFRNVVTADGSSGFPAEAGRYHLYISLACGWSHRTLMFRALKGLDEVVSVSHMQPFMGEEGWLLEPGDDPIHNARALYEVYQRAKPGYTGRASVPVLWDKETASIVSNESLDIARSFDREFDALGSGGRRYFVEDRIDEIDAMIAANYEAVNNGVYKAGFARSQEAHETASRAIFARFDELEAILSKQRYLLGDDVTAADWYLFPTLYRFDACYYVHFKCNLRLLRDYPNLWAYTRDLYQTPAVAGTCDLEHAKRHYFTSHESIHPRRYVPIGPLIDFDEPHGRG